MDAGTAFAAIMGAFVVVLTALSIRDQTRSPR